MAQLAASHKKKSRKKAPQQPKSKIIPFILLILIIFLGINIYKTINQKQAEGKKIVNPWDKNSIINDPVTQLIKAINFYNKNEMWDKIIIATDSLANYTSPEDDWYLNMITLKGTACYKLEQWDCAKENLREAIFRKKSPEIDKILQRLKAIEAENSLYKIRTPHFEIYFEGDKSKSHESSIQQQLENIYKRLSLNFGYNLNKSLAVVIFENEMHSGLRNRPKWSGALYDGRIRIPAESIEQWDQAKKIISHEMAHAFVSSMGGTNVPAWLNEGLAQKSEPSFVDSNILKFKVAPDISNLSKKNFINIKNYEQAKKLYIFSLAMLKQLTESINYNSRSIEMILKEFKNTNNLNSSLENNLNITLNELYEETAKKYDMPLN